MPLVPLCLRHFSADSIICTCEFEFRQAQGPGMANTAIIRDAYGAPAMVAGSRTGREDAAFYHGRGGGAPDATGRMGSASCVCGKLASGIVVVKGAKDRSGDAGAAAPSS